MRKLYTLILIFLPAIIFAQSNYQQGFIVKSNGDTLKGYINYREWSENPHSIEFKQSKNDGQASVFNPTTAKAFQINGMETYLTFSGNVSMDKTHFPDLPDHLDTSKKFETAFLKQLATGKFLSLYAFTDEIKTRFFIAEKNNVPVELTYYTYYSENREVVTTPVYKGQLGAYIGRAYPGSTKFDYKINGSRYEESDLVSLINKVNATTAPASQKSSIRLFAGVGASFNKTDIDNVYFYQNKESLSSVSPKISAGIDIFQNPNVQQFIFRLELSYFYVKPEYKASHITDQFGTQTESLDYTYTQNNITFTPQLIFNLYNTNDLKAYIGGGLAVNLSTYSNDKLIVVNKGANQNSTETKPKPHELSSTWLAIPIEAGVMINKQFEIGVMYSLRSSYDKGEAGGFSASNQTISAGFKYFFSKL